MKKILTIASVLFSTVVFAGGTDENPSSVAGAAILKKGESTFSVIYKGSESKVTVSILDSRNRQVFSETVKNETGFLRPYNFAGLREGEYTIAIADATGTKTEKVIYRSGAVSKQVNLVKMADGDKYLFTAAGKGEENITLNIFDQANQLVHSELKSISGDFAQVYNLSKIGGQPTFEIVHQNGESKKIKY
ncbi:MAG: hypothetical protein ACOYW3_07370 [Bacteroidota bacterium]